MHTPVKLFTILWLNLFKKILKKILAHLPQGWKNRLKHYYHIIAFLAKRKAIVALYKVYFGDEWLETSIRSIIDTVDGVVVGISLRAWADDEIKGDDLTVIVERLSKQYGRKIKYFTGCWDNQFRHVCDTYDYLRSAFPNATHVLYIDSDEVYASEEIAKLVKYAHDFRITTLALSVSMHTYFKSVKYRIDPPEDISPLALFPILPHTRFLWFRRVNIPQTQVAVWMHHFSYVRSSDERIKNKLAAYRNDEQLIEGWFEDVWCNWTTTTRDFHPVKPALYHSIKQVTSFGLPPGVIERAREFEASSKQG